jgi:hypothetical protein
VTARPSIVAWAEREALDARGGFRSTPPFAIAAYEAYHAAHFVIGVSLLGRPDLVRRVFASIAPFVDGKTGGVSGWPANHARGNWRDLLTTAQYGLAALHVADADAARRVRDWVFALYEMQPDLPQKLYTVRDERGLCMPNDAAEARLAVTDFNAPRQAYFNPGIAAAFLAAYALQYDDSDAMALGEKYLLLNIAGDQDVQFEDRESVQICKFGWGAAAMAQAGSRAHYAVYLVRMAHWFADRQADDGSWSPSSFLVAAPDEVDRLVKTAEHLMEAAEILSALAVLSARAVEKVSATRLASLAQHWREEVLWPVLLGSRRSMNWRAWTPLKPRREFVREKSRHVKPWRRLSGVAVNPRLNVEEARPWRDRIPPTHG